MWNLVSKGSCDTCYRRDVNICYSCVSQNSFLLECVIWIDLLDYITYMGFDQNSSSWNVEQHISRLNLSLSVVTVISRLASSKVFGFLIFGLEGQL